MPEQPVISEHHTDAVPEATADARVVASQASENGEHPSGLTIIASKIAPASAGRPVLTRPRLVGWLDQQREARVILVSAEAGYGKSTLLGDFSLRSDATCIWYRMETSDGDWITFLSYMVAALRDVVPDFGRQTEALLRHVAAMGSSRELVVAQFLADLGGLGNAELIVILDDYHLAGGADDVRLIMSRLVERAPAGMRFILAGRGRPNLALGRLAAQGRVAELTTTDLRFTRPEIEELFAVTYAQPLDEHAKHIVVERTRGWAASLQLVSASIAVSRPSEVGSFIEALSGATGPIYDFLAEEVLSRMSPMTQRILVHASLMDRVTPELVTAALSVTREDASLETVSTHLEAARMLGLLGEGGDSAGTRIHPLFRQFLEHQLAAMASAEQLRAMHRAIAQAAEQMAWLTAAKHYALAGEPDASMRVLGSAASEALGTGAWGGAVEVIALMPDTPPPPAVEVIKARALISSGRSRAALALLGHIDRSRLEPEDRGLIALTCATAYHLEGEGKQLAEEVRAVALDDAIPSPIHEVAVSWQQMLVANRGGCITDAVDLLQQLAIDQVRSGLRYFAGVTLHNTANAELARGNYRKSAALANQALEQLSQVDEGASISASTRSISAMCAAELGHLAEGLRAAVAAATEPGATADAIAEAAYLNAVSGRVHRARSLLVKFDRGDAPWSRELASRAQACFARIALHISEGDLGAARSAWKALDAIKAPDIDAESRTAVVAAVLAAVTESDDFVGLSHHALTVAASQHAWRWMARARILDAVARRDAGSLVLWIGEAEHESGLALLELADPIATSVGLLAPIPEALERSILQAPARWVAALGKQVLMGRDDNASAAASLIARFGTISDASVLREFDRVSNPRSRKRGYVTRLIRRVSPTVRVHDLGPTSYDVGDRHVALTETRRKAATLLLFLVTRPQLAATREQVMEGLWPDQTPKSAMNSLHQTLFFLRRDIEPWYEDGTTADYIRMESDMVFLDSELFQVDSVAFNRQVAEIVRTGSVTDRGPEMLRLYKGRFAPEFEYEEWAEDWRTQLHGAYLHLAHCTVEALIRSQRLADAIDVLNPVAIVDPLAFDLRATLVACLATLGATDAAQAHYRSLATLHARDLGVPARPYDEIVGGLGM